MKRDTLGAGCRPNYPKPEVDDDCGTPQPVKTLLDEFAMAAMEGSDLAIWKINGAGGLADNCYNVAAAMMKERGRRDEIGNVKEVE